MKNIELKKMKLSYFKGIKDLEIEFNHVTNIFGTNGAGKSTVSDAWNWLLFGKNMAGESDTKFSIKTLDENNVEIPKIDHSVEAWLMVDGEEIVAKRVLREKWVKSHGALEAEFTGNETVYFWNNVPKSKREYDSKISELLDENVFKMITDPMAFNNLHWEKQRELLINISGEVKNEDVAASDKDFSALLDKLSNKDLDEYSKELAAKRLILNKEIKGIPTRIDEANRGMPIVSDADIKDAESKKEAIDKEILEVDSLIEDRNKAVDAVTKKRTAISSEIFELKTKVQNIEFEEKTKIESAKTPDPLGDLPSELEKAQADLLKYTNAKSSLDHQLAMDQDELKSVADKKTELREQFTKENASELKFDEGAFVCPGCKRGLEADDVEAEKEVMIKKFKEDKKIALEKINESGVKVSQREKTLLEQISNTNVRIEGAVKAITETEASIKELSDKIAAIKAIPAKEVESFWNRLSKALLDRPEWQSTKSKITELETSLKGDTGFDVSDLKERKTALSTELDAVKAILSQKQVIETQNKRIIELKNEEKKLAQEISSIEKMQDVAQRFTTRKISMLEDGINKMFGSGVKFKMFKQQIDGVIPWCYCLVNGVPFSDANTASKINAGLNIINVLSKHYNVSAPCFIDDRNLVIDLIDTDSQIINLIVSEPDKVLRIG